MSIVAIEDKLCRATPDFSHLQPVTSAYATVPILDGFTWDNCFAQVSNGQWYLVVFRSVRSAHADTAVLTEYDDHAYDEALKSSGLLHYFRGELNEQRECLSFCVWESTDHAQIASVLPRHRAAAQLAATMYDSFTLERWLLTKIPASPHLTVHPLPAMTHGKAGPVCQY